MITEFLVSDGERRKRLDLFLLHRERDISRSGLQRLITMGRVRLNAQVVKPGHKIKPGDRITMDNPPPGPLLFKNDPLPLDILYEDDSLIVLNKPSGIVVHPTSGNWTGTILNAVLAHVQNSNAEYAAHAPHARPGIVHRLDKDTSGVMVIAKTIQAHRGLAIQFERHAIHRTYEAVVWNVPTNTHGMINMPIGRDRHRTRHVSPTSADPKRAVTHYQVAKSFGDKAAHVVLTPQTGRTHQLRVHMASIGCPILGDQTYGGQKVGQIHGLQIPRMLLHARMLGYHHPESGRYQEYEVGSPPDMQGIIQAIGE